MTFSINSANAQALNDYKVYNKSRCLAVVRVGCTSGSAVQHIIQSNGSIIGDCGVGNEVCFVQIDFDDGNIGAEVVDVNPLLSCASPMPFNLGSICFAGNIDWPVLSGYQIINFY